MERMEVELPIQNIRLVAISEIFVAQTGSMCYSIEAQTGSMCYSMEAQTGSMCYNMEVIDN